MDTRPATSLRLAVELRPCGDGLAGSVTDEQGAEHSFTGWLGLLTLLETARTKLEPATGA
jgi:hypothetical protein